MIIMQARTSGGSVAGWMDGWMNPEMNKLLEQHMEVMKCRIKFMFEHRTAWSGGSVCSCSN